MNPVRSNNQTFKHERLHDQIVKILGSKMSLCEKLSSLKKMIKSTDVPERSI